MNRFIFRLIVLLLIPPIIVDPAVAAGLTNSLFTTCGIRLAGAQACGGRGEPFQEQALASQMVNGGKPIQPKSLTEQEFRMATQAEGLSPAPGAPPPLESGSPNRNAGSDAAPKIGGIPIEILRGGKPGKVISDEEPVALFDPETRLPLHQAAGRREVHDRGLWHAAVHVYLVDRRGRLLLQRRSRTLRTSPGRLQVSVSGHVDFADVKDVLDRLDTPWIFKVAKREGKEELGIPLDRKKLVLLQGMNAVRRDEPDNREFASVLYYPVSDEEIEKARLTYDLNEVEELVLLPFGELRVAFAAAPQEFSGSIKYLLTQDPGLFEELQALAKKEGERSIAPAVEGATGSSPQTSRQRYTADPVTLQAAMDELDGYLRSNHDKPAIRKLLSDWYASGERPDDVMKKLSTYLKRGDLDAMVAIGRAITGLTNLTSVEPRKRGNRWNKGKKGISTLPGLFLQTGLAATLAIRISRSPGAPDYGRLSVFLSKAFQVAVKLDSIVSMTWHDILHSGPAALFMAVTLGILGGFGIFRLWDWLFPGPIWKGTHHEVFAPLRAARSFAAQNELQPAPNSLEITRSVALGPDNALALGFNPSGILENQVRLLFAGGYRLLIDPRTLPDRFPASGPASLTPALSPVPTHKKIEGNAASDFGTQAAPNGSPSTLQVLIEHGA